MRSLLPLLLLTLGAALAAGPLTGCKSRSEPPAQSKIAEDASRIVALGGAVTETVFALGLGENVVAADASSAWPPEVAARATLPYFRMVNAEGILALEPTVVLASEGTVQSSIDQLREAGVQVIDIPDASSLAGAKARIEAVASALKREDRGATLIAQLDAQVAETEALRARCVEGDGPAVLAIYARGSRAQLVMGADTGMDAMIRLAGARNAAAAISGTKPITAEAVLEGAPDVVLVPEASLESLGGESGLRELAGLQHLGAQTRIVTMDDQLLLALGPRLGEAALVLTERLHGCARVN